MAYPPHRQLLVQLKHDPIQIFDDHDLAFAEIAHVSGFNWPGQVAGEQEAGPGGLDVIDFEGHANDAQVGRRRIRLTVGFRHIPFQPA